MITYVIDLRLWHTKLLVQTLACGLHLPLL